MISNKKLTVSLLIGISCLALTGCGERDNLIKDGTKAYSQGNYVQAYEFFAQADRLEPIKEEALVTKYNDIRNKLYVGYVDQGKVEKDKQNNKEALKLFETAYAIYAQDEQLNVLLAETKFLVAQQETFDKYLKLFVPVLKDSNKILNVLNQEVDKLYVKSISDKDFIITIKSLIPESNKIVSKIDEALYATETKELLPIHQQLIDVVQLQHDTLLKALDYETNFEFGLDDLNAQRIEIKRQQTSLLESLKTYASDNSLKFSLDSSEEVNKKQPTE